MWITSSRVLPVIMLVVIPFSATILAVILNNSVPYILTEVIEGFSYPVSYIYLISISSVVYALYPIRLRNIERRGFLNLLIEHAYIKKILYFEISMLIVCTVITFLGSRYFLNLYPNDRFVIESLLLLGAPFDGYSIFVIAPSYGPPLNDVGGEYIWAYLVFGLLANFVFSVIAGIIWMILVSFRKLEYNFAKTLFQTATQEESSNKAEYLVKGIKIYDKYLRRRLNLEINNAKKIYSKILSDPNLDKNESIRMISESFNGKDKFQPIKVLSQIAYVEDDKDTFLVDESIGKKIKDMAIFFVTIIPVAITVMQLLLQRE
jgi:hypothetical protein